MTARRRRLVRVRPGWAWRAEYAGVPVPWPPHVGRWVRTAKGNTAHVLVDPDIDARTVAALEALIDAAHEALRKGTLGTTR